MARRTGVPSIRTRGVSIRDVLRRVRHGRVVTSQPLSPPAPAAPPSAPPHRLRRGAALIASRWPTWLALAVAGVNLLDVGDGTELAFVLVVAGVGYLAVAVLERPRATWPLALLLFAGIVGLRAAGIDERVVVPAVGVALAVAGLVRGSLRRPGLTALQLPAAVVFVGAGLVGAGVSPDAGLIVVALGLIAHAAWDAYHWWVDRIIARSFTEWCGVLDLTLGIGILLLV